MTDIDFIVQHMIEQANELDTRGRFAEANKIDRYAKRIVTSGYGGGVAEYVGKLLELARSKGIDYMKERMQESRIVTLNDGTPVIKQNDAQGFIDAVVSRAKALKLPETKGLAPNAPGKMDAQWSGESTKRMEEIESGKSSWLNQSKPYTDAVSEKKVKRQTWTPPVAPTPKVESPKKSPVALTPKSDNTKKPPTTKTPKVDNSKNPLTEHIFTQAPKVDNSKKSPTYNPFTG